MGEKIFRQLLLITWIKYCPISFRNDAITGGISDTVSGFARKIFFLLIDSGGNELAFSLFPEAYDGYSIAPTYDDGFIIAADDLNPASMDPGFFLIKINEYGELTGEMDVLSQENNPRFFPNPSNGIFTFVPSGNRSSNSTV